MAKPKRRKATLHSTGKVTEQDLLARARALRDDPSLAMPICEGACVWFSPVTAARKGIQKAHAARDDEGKLQRLASGGNDLARAYAATLLVARAEKIPYVAELRLPGESVPYVMRGKAKPFYLAGVQHYDDRALRLLAVTGWAKKRRINFWSTGRGVVCTGRSNVPPQDFVEEEVADLGLSAKPGAAGVYVCEHGGAASGDDTVVVDWAPAKARLERCEECIGDGSTLRELLRHMAGFERRRAFRAKVQLKPLEAAAGAAPDVDAPLPNAVHEKYLAGSMSDAELIQAARAARIEALKAMGTRIFVAGDASYGDDANAFVDALAPNEAERTALHAALAREEGAVVLDKPSSARALAELWPRHARTMLEAAAGHAATADSLVRDTVTPEEAADLVRRAAREGAARNVQASLPTYQGLPPAAAAADAIARAFRAQGRDAAVRVAIERASAGKAKGVALAALLEMDAAKGQEWRFSGADTDVAASAREAVRGLLSGPAESYHDALREATRRAGETAEFAPR